MKSFQNTKIAKLAAIGAAISLFSGAVGYAAGEWENIWVQFDSVNLMVNGQNVTSSNLLYNDRTYVPLRACAEMLGSTVGWDQNSNTASITGGSDIDAVKMKATAQLMERFNLITEVALRLEVCERDFNEYYSLALGNTYGKDKIYAQSISYFNQTIEMYNECIASIPKINSDLQLIHLDPSDIPNMIENYGLCIDKFKEAYDIMYNFDRNNGDLLTDKADNAIDLRNKGRDYIKKGTEIKDYYIDQLSDIV